MNNLIKDTILITAVGTAGFCAYKMISPRSRDRLSRDIRRTVEDMGEVKKDMFKMAGTIKDSF